MTAPAIEQLPVRIPRRTLPPRLVHACCLVCTPTDRTFCGLDATDMPFRQAKGEKPTCVVCFELHESHDWTGCLGAS